MTVSETIAQFNNLRSRLMSLRDEIFDTLEETGHELQTIECHELNEAVDQMAEYLDDLALELDAN